MQATPALSADDPYLVGHGPVECSTCTALSVPRVIVWDSNGYYRELGVDSTATRAQLRRAYVGRGGSSSARLTYALKQLLDPEVRAAYDATPLGRVFMDRYVLADLNRRIKDRLARQTQRLTSSGWLVTEEVERLLLERLADQFGMERVDGSSEDSPQDSVDADSEHGQDDQQFGFSSYRWRSGASSDQRLERWQTDLIRAFASRGIVTRLAVGVHGGTSGDLACPWLLARVGYRTVVFLHEGQEPSMALAESVAARAYDSFIPSRERYFYHV